MALVKESTHDFNSYVETNISTLKGCLASMPIRDYKVTVNVGHLEKGAWQRE